MAAEDSPFFVLVGGEHPDLGGAYGEWGIEHCSLKQIGYAYDRLRRNFARSQIIVVAQLDEALAHMKKAALDGIPQIAPADSDEPKASKALWQWHLDTTRASCERLLHDGGAQYDGTAVNAGTVLGVILGEADSLNGPVVPRTGSRSLHLAIYSHGDLQLNAPTEDQIPPCDVCGAPHGPETEVLGHEYESHLAQEWYLHMPHPSSRTAPELQWVATENARRPQHYLYATQLRAAFSSLRQERPQMPICTLFNACRSGCGLKWLQNLQRLEWAEGLLRLRDWPILMISSCGATQDALVGGMWTAWFNQLDALMQADENATLGEVYRLASAQYRSDNHYDVLNRIRSDARPRNPESVDALLHGIRAALIARTGIDWCAIRDLQEAHEVHEPVLCLSCNDFRGTVQQEWLCSACWRSRNALPASERPQLPPLVLKPADLSAVVKSALLASAQPQECHGEASGIMAMKLRDVFPRAKT
eukprot:TRINITY_DN70060_c0_g1_i1.p1 TRINITY_DN70060_c0_g1~~TRINITY_DN70060_c0_g1_i1.p1  ORF type:complete len:475 (+),score=57.33 TRINITY_DN70060_c0_g1_i1:60-1484(+)